MGITGVSIWPLYYWNVIAWYNGRSHAIVQIDCFVYAFIVGFLFYPVLPRGLMQARGLAFGGVALITALVLYDRAKAWLIAKSQHDP